MKTSHTIVILLAGTDKEQVPTNLVFSERTFGPSLATSLEPLAHWQNVASLSLLYGHYYGRCSSELAQLVPFPYSCGKSTCYSDTSHDFLVTIPRCYKDVYVNSFFPSTARLCNSLLIECFPLTYDLNGFNRGSCILLCFNLFAFLFLDTQLFLKSRWKTFSLFVGEHTRTSQTRT